MREGAVNDKQDAESKKSESRDVGTANFAVLFPKPAVEGLSPVCLHNNRLMDGKASASITEIQSLPNKYLIFNFIADCIIPDSGTVPFVLCEIQPALISVLPYDIQTALIDGLHKRLSPGGELFLAGSSRAHPFDFHEKLLDTTALPGLNHLNNICLFKFGEEISSGASLKLGYRDQMSVHSDRHAPMFNDKALQRIIIDAIDPSLNPDRWFVFTINDRPSLKQLHAEFPDGFIIKAARSTRGEGISTADFRTEEELDSFLRRSKNYFFVAESFVVGTQERQGKRFTAQRRLYFSHVDDESRLLGIQDTLAPVALGEGSGDSELEKVCHTREGYEQVNLRPRVLPEFQSGATEKMQRFMQELHRVDFIKVLKQLMQHENRIYNEIAVDFIQISSKKFFVVDRQMCSYHTQDVCELVAKHSDGLSDELLQDLSDELKKSKGLFENPRAVLALKQQTSDAYVDKLVKAIDDALDVLERQLSVLDASASSGEMSP